MDNVEPEAVEGRQQGLGVMVCVGCRWDSTDKCMSILVESGPPKVLQQDVLDKSNARMAREVGSVSPLKNVRARGQRDEQAFRRTGTGTRLSLNGCFYPLFNLPGE